MTALQTDILAELVRARHACLVQLRDMGRRQIELIAAGNMTALLDLLSAKQRPLAELQRIEKALDPFRAEDPSRRRWRTAEDRADCAQRLEQCEALLSEITAQEKQSEQSLVRRRDEAAARLQGAHLAGQARGAYAAAARQQAGQLDLMSER